MGFHRAAHQCHIGGDNKGRPAVKPAMLALTALAFTLPAAAQQSARVTIPGQGQGTVTFFERPNFGGAAITFRNTENNIRIPFNVRSVKAEGVWRLCSDTNLRGACLFANSSYPDSQRDLGLRGNIRSVEARSNDNGNAGWSGPVGGATLRGTSSQYWSNPEINRRRIESCPNGNGSANCAAATADRFCAYAGWRRAAYHMQLTVNRQNVLADVLCTNR
jgi:hypothetical protein